MSKKPWAYRGCTFPGCRNPHKAKGLCRTHYSQVQRGEIPHPVTNRPETCSFEGCDKRHNSHGYCSSHSRQYVAGEQLRPLRAVRDVTERDAAGRKMCARCVQWLPEPEFKPAPHTSDGLRVWCQVCVNTRRYNITRTDYERLLSEQGNCCAICFGHSRDGKALHIDHDHACCPVWGRSCGKCVRGLLCSECNKGLGHFKDSVGLLAHAAIYVYTRQGAA